MKAVKIPNPKETLRLEQTPLPQVEKNGVLVKVASCGICHTDLHLWEGGYHGAPGFFIDFQKRGVPYPLTPGHEVSGVVEAVGSEVRQTKVGDKVLIYPWLGDGTCAVCLRGEENLCDDARALGMFRDGG